MTPAKRGGKRVGYTRVSTVDQNAERQLDGVQVDKTFTDKASGKDTNRPQFQAALEYLREGDVLVVHSMDRLARNLDDLRRIVADLTARGIVIEFVKEQLTFNGDDSALSRMLLSVMGAFAEFERALLKERQREGIALAKRAGVYKGRKPAPSDEQAAVLRDRVKSGVPQSSSCARVRHQSGDAVYLP
jgi:DNA invertase Pin-like site-specific DNA recombinase